MHIRNQSAAFNLRRADLALLAIEFASRRGRAGELHLHALRGCSGQFAETDDDLAGVLGLLGRCHHDVRIVAGEERSGLAERTLVLGDCLLYTSRCV